MKNFKLSVLVSAFLLSACGGTTAVKQEPKSMQAETSAKQASEPMQKQAQAKMVPSLNEAQLKSLLVGNTKTGVKNGKRWTDTYLPNGMLKGTSGKEHADTGTYSIKGNLVCTKWSRWQKGGTNCWTIQKQGDGYNATLKSGTSNSPSHKFTMLKQAQTGVSSNLNDAEIKALLVGKTITGVHKGKPWTSVISPDGTLAYTHDGKPAGKGVYTIKNNMYCRTRREKSACWTISKRADGYFAELVSGESFSFPIRFK